MTGREPGVEWPPTEERQRGFDRMYATQPDRFAGAPSRFSDWALALFRTHAPRGRLLDLGCGLGRDARRFAAEGYEVLASDFSEVAIDRARAHPGNPTTLRFEHADAVSTLRALPSASQDVVYAHALYMMLPEEELSTVFREVHRTLRAGGLHLFAVRSVSDPMASEGDEVAPGVRRPVPRAGDPAPAPPYRYFSAESLDRWTGRGFVRLESEEPSDLHFWFVADRRP